MIASSISHIRYDIATLEITYAMTMIVGLCVYALIKEKAVMTASVPEDSCQSLALDLLV
jgi:hypothetical protein